MDGYALSAQPPGAYRLVAPSAPVSSVRLAPGEAVAVRAGGALPAQTATVVLANRARVSHGTLEVREAPLRDNIRRVGEETLQGALLCPPGVMLEARRMALLAMAGLGRVDVTPRAKVALLGLAETGGPSPQSLILRALLNHPALELVDAGTAPDVGNALARLANTQQLILVTGASLGDEDGPLARAIHGAGGTVGVLRAALKPAKPVICGHLGAATVIGIGGTPYAVAAAAHLFLAPVLAKLVGLAGWEHPFLPALADFTRARMAGRAEALPVCLRMSGGALHLTSAGRFGQLTALAALDGFALVDGAAEDIAPGDPMAFLKWRAPLLP